MMFRDKFPLPKIGSAAAGANEPARFATNVLLSKLLVEKIVFTPDTAVTADASNKGILTIKIGATTIATMTTDLAQGDLVAGTVYDIPLTASGADLEIDSLEAVSVTKTYGGTGAVMSGMVELRVSDIRS